MTIRAGHYDEVERRLRADPVVRAMARELRGAGTWGAVHEDGTPSHGFMLSANRTYAERGGEITGKHIGAVARAVLALARASESERGA